MYDVSHNTALRQRVLTSVVFSFSFAGHRFFMTAEEMLDHFGGVMYSLCHYRKGKKARRIPYARLMAYLRKHAHSRLLREML